jgi:hypothetical protein
MPEIKQGFAHGIEAIDARYQVTAPLYPPVVGAALYAAMLAGKPLSTDALQRLGSVGD